MAKSNFEDFVNKERTRLNEVRQEALSRRALIDAEVAEVDRELAAIAAYERARTGKKKTGTRAPRTDGRRAAVLTLIEQHPDGLPRADILEGLGVKGDKSAEQSVSNALNNLKKAGKLDQRDGRYIAA